MRLKTTQSSESRFQSRWDPFPLLIKTKSMHTWLCVFSSVKFCFALLRNFKTLFMLICYAFALNTFSNSTRIPLRAQLTSLFNNNNKNSVKNDLFLVSLFVNSAISLHTFLRGTLSLEISQSD